MNLRSGGVRVLSIITIVALVTLPHLALARGRTGSDYMEGEAAGRDAGSGNPAWALAGFGCGLFGVIGVGLFSNPEPPAAALVGQTPDYVLGYREGYRKKAKSRNYLYAAVGWAVAIPIVIYVTVNAD